MMAALAVGQPPQVARHASLMDFPPLQKNHDHISTPSVETVEYNKP